MTEDGNNARHVREFLSWQRDTRNRSGGTIYHYASTLDRLLSFLARTPLEEATLDQLEDWINRPRGGRAYGNPAAPNTRRKDASIVRGLYHFLMERGAITRNPAALLSAPTIPQHHPKPMSDTHWLRLWDSDLDIACRVTFGLGFYCGLRRKEIAELRPEQVSVSPSGGLTREGRIVGFKRKGGGDDIFPMGDVLNVFDERMPSLRAGELLLPLDQYVQKRQGHPYLLQWGEEAPSARRAARKHAIAEGLTDPQAINKRMEVACRRARVPHHTPHQLRHSFVTNLLRAGVPLHLASRLANHSDPRVTMGYVKAGGSELREWLSGISRHS